MSPPAKTPQERAARFWESYHARCLDFDEKHRVPNNEVRELAARMRISAPMQILAVESVEARKGLVKHLAGMETLEATQALTKLALFSPEGEMRECAREALKTRAKKESADVLLHGLRYPWPAVAERAAEAVVKLKRADLIPRLVDLLDEPDPREPLLKEVERKKVSVVRELVRINHHRNCLLCHAPNDPKAGAFIGAIPRPDEPLPPLGSYDSESEILIRADVTYLRQDFSLLLPVDNADPWPKMQRFDFLVRSRVLTDAEAKAHQDLVQKRDAGYVSPYHRAIHTALRELTGRDAEPNAKAWREALK